MVDNAPFLSTRHGNLTIEGYSRAAVQSVWRIPELKLGFDLGAHPWEFMGTSTWLISHVHLDHIAALPSYVARRRLMKMDPPTIYLPEHAIAHVKHVLFGFSKLDRGRLPCELIGVIPGDVIDFSRELVIDVIKTSHTIPSVGYVISERRHKLKPEFSERSGDEIRDLRNSGVEVTEERLAPWVGYVGDSNPKGLDDNPILYQTKILISEMTFVAPNHRRELIHKNGHMHLDDYVRRQDQFANELVIAGHLSTRYNAKQAETMVHRKLPDLLKGKLKLWI